MITPGPYKIERDDWAVMVMDPSGNMIAEFTILHPFGSDKVRPITPDEAEANAQLWIAAAREKEQQ